LKVKKSFKKKIETFFVGLFFSFVLALAQVILVITEKPTLREKPIEASFIRKRA